jgi:hypothetical protein
MVAFFDISGAAFALVLSEPSDFYILAGISAFMVFLAACTMTYSFTTYNSSSTAPLKIRKEQKEYTLLDDGREGRGGKYGTEKKMEIEMLPTSLKAAVNTPVTVSVADIILTT